MVSKPQSYRFTTSEYDQLVEKGILPEDARLELVDGEIIQMTPISRRHAGLVRRFSEAFREFDRRVVQVDVQNPIRLGNRSEPQPDLTLLRRRPDDYDSDHPAAADVLLIVEIAGSSLDHDRHAKASIYAENRIPEYWLVDINVVPATVTVYREPHADGFHSIQVVPPGDPLAPLAFPGAALDTERLLR